VRRERVHVLAIPQI